MTFIYKRFYMSKNEIERLKKENIELRNALTSKNELIDNLPCTVSWINNDLKYVEINKKLGELINMDQDSVSNQSVGFMVGKNDIFHRFINDFFNGNKTYSEIEYTTKVDNKINHHSLVAQRYKEMDEAVIIGFDITERKNLEQRIKDDERLRVIGEVATGIMHEINNPLTVIYTAADLLEMDADILAPDKIKEHAKNIQDMGDRISHIVNGLKNLARDTSKDKKELTSLKRIINESLLIIKSKIMQNGVTFSINEDIGHNIEVSCVEGRIIQVLVNLIGNACEAAQETTEKWVRVKVNIDDQYVSFNIMDSGQGIENEVADNMFKPFFTTKPKGIGTGMGMGICKEIAHEHSGSLKYQLEDGHTNFTFKIPK